MGFISGWYWAEDLGLWLWVAGAGGENTVHDYDHAPTNYDTPYHGILVGEENWNALPMPGHWEWNADIEHYVWITE